jgi:hypothetical protein
MLQLTNATTKDDRMNECYNKEFSSIKPGSYNERDKRSSLNVSDQVSHPYKATGKITDLYILIFVFLNSKVEDKTLCTK